MAYLITDFVAFVDRKSRVDRFGRQREDGPECCLHIEQCRICFQSSSALCFHYLQENDLSRFLYIVT